MSLGAGLYAFQTDAYSLRESVLSVHHMEPADGTQVSRLGSKCLYLMGGLYPFRSHKSKVSTSSLKLFLSERQEKRLLACQAEGRGGDLTYSRQMLANVGFSPRSLLTSPLLSKAIG